MIEVSSLDCYKSIVSEFKKSGEKPFSNCFLMPNEIQRLTEEKKLFALLNDEWLFLLCDRGDYFSVYYYAFAASGAESAKTLFEKEKFSKELLLDVTFRGANGDKSTVKTLVSGGVFGEYKTYKRMLLSFRNAGEGELKAEVAPGYRLEKSADYETVLSLWKTGLDEKSTPLPTREDFEEFEKAGLFFALADEKGETACVLVLNRRGKNALIEHLVCSPAHRRRGLAKSLFILALQSAKETGVLDARLWVDEKNTPAISLYEKLGFLDDGTKSEQYIFNNNR